MMDEVWVVSSGVYSAYTVHFACPSKEHAERAAARINEIDPDASEARAESIPMRSDLPERDETLSITATIDLQGNVIEEPSEWSHVEWEFNPKPEMRASVSAVAEWDRWTRARTITGFRVGVMGNDPERVRRAFSEQLAQARTDAMAGVLVAK